MLIVKIITTSRTIMLKKTCENDKFNFFSGNCLELAARGFLNQVPCNLTFSSGCPDKFFYSPELYKCMYNLKIYSRYRKQYQNDF